MGNADQDTEYKETHLDNTDQDLESQAMRQHGEVPGGWGHQSRQEKMKTLAHKQFKSKKLTPTTFPGEK